MWVIWLIWTIRMICMIRMLTASVILALWHILLDETARVEETGDVIEHTIHITTAARSAVCLGKIHILVDSNDGWDARESHHLGDGNLHNYHIHVSQASEIPVAAGALYCHRL